MHTRNSLLLLLLLACFGWSSAQTYNVSVQGTLINATTGLPMANRAVYLDYDSTAFFSYNAVLYTDTLGHYADVASVPGMLSSGNVSVKAFDCPGNLVTLAVHAFSTSNNAFNQQDSLCRPGSANCPPVINYAVFSPGSYIFSAYVAGVPANSVSSWNWDFGDGATASIQAPAHNFAVADTYLVCLTTLTASGCFAAVCDTIVVAAPATCALSFTHTNQGANYSFTSNATSPAGIASYEWGFGDGGWSALQNPTHTYTLNGVYPVWLEIFAQDSCFALAYDTVYHNAGICDAEFDFVPTSNNGVTFFNTSYVPQGTSLTSLLWDFGDGGTDTSQYPAPHIYAALGSYVVCLTIHTSNGCTSTFCDTVTVYPTPSCTPAFSYFNQGCAFSFVNSSTSSTPITNYSWNFGDGNTSTAANPTHTYAISGSYLACLEILTQDSCWSVYCDTVTCGSQPSCLAGFYWYPDSSGQYTLIVVNTSLGSNLSYLWDFGDGGTSTQAYPSHVYAGAGNYNVCLTVNDGQGCSSTFCDSMVVLNRLSQPFSIQVVSTATSVAPPVQDVVGMQLVPNPASQTVRLALQLAKQGKGQLRLVDAQGRTAKSIALGQLHAGEHSQAIDLSDLPAGIYLAELLVNGQRSVQKLVVTR